MEEKWECEFCKSKVEFIYPTYKDDSKTYFYLLCEGCKIGWEFYLENEENPHE
jgi:hypothetical protein